MVGLIVFGGVDPVSNVVVSESAFEVGFSKERNCEVWKKIGAAPLTRACLQNHSHVRREMGDADDGTNNTMKLIQCTNDLSTYFLKEHGFNSDVFKVAIKKVRKQTVTVRHSQERINAISQATSHGTLFHATGGGHLTDDDVFLGLQKKKVEEEIKRLKKTKDAAMRMGEIGTKAQAILQKPKSYTNYTRAELSVLLSYYQIKGSSTMKKDAMIEKWKEILESRQTAPACGGWSDEDEKRLNHLTSQPITIGDTALGRHHKVIKRQVSNIITKMSKEERSELKRKLEQMEDEGDSQEGSITVMPNVDAKIPPPNPDEQQPLDQWEEETEGECDLAIV
jgi:hypothetical protein